MKILIGTLLATGLLVGGYMLTQNPSSGLNIVGPNEAPVLDPNQVFEQNNGTTPSGEPVATIRFAESGYQPALVTIKKGEPVRWINDSADETWPAAAVHPTHSMYPQKSADDCLGSSFDACRGLVQGEEWEFTFTEVGTWRFHDHLHPSKTGSIIVE